MSERFVCLNCNVIAPLNRFGNCATCGSVAVVSEHGHQVCRVDAERERMDDDYEQILEAAEANVRRRRFRVVNGIQ